MKQLGRRDWQALAGVLRDQALLAARLLRGEMPENIEEVFRKARISLFPERRGDLETSCSCPDWSDPCKHIAATYYLLGEEFDRDPFLIFRLRGMERDEFVGLLEGKTGRERQAKEPDRKSKGTRRAVRRTSRAYQQVNKAAASAVAEPEPDGKTADSLSPDPARFWRSDLPPTLGGIKTEVPPLTAALPKQLGSVPFWRGEEELMDFLLPVYEAASAAALKLLER